MEHPVLQILVLDQTLRDAYVSRVESRDKEDSGVDLFFSIKEPFPVDQNSKIVKTGIKARVLYGGKRKCFNIIPRSSIYKTLYGMANGIGLIDSGYNGEIGIPLYSRSFERTWPKHGESYFQIFIPWSHMPPIVEFVDSFEETNRGEKGFGSTGNFLNDKKQSTL